MIHATVTVSRPPSVGVSTPKHIHISGVAYGARMSADYNDLLNKPSINGVTLEGNLTTEDLHIQAGVTSWNGETGDVTYAAPVTSVNGQTGDVTIAIPTVPVESVNGQTGAVVLDASDVGALPDSTVIPDKVSQLTNDSGYITGIDSTDVTTALGYTPYNSSNPDGFVNSTQAANAAPVQSVNGQTGAVSLTIPTVPSNVSAFTNDAGYVNSLQAAEAAPVQSVNSKTGDVVLDASDVGAIPADTEFEITYDPLSSVDLALVDEAETAEPNYTPAGSVSATLNWEYKNNKLYIYGVNTTFTGNGVKLAIKEAE